MESSPECIGRAPGVARITEQFVSQECPSSDISSRQRELNSKLREQTRQRALSASIEADEKEVFVRNKTGAIHRSNLILHPLRQCKDPGTASLYATTSLSTASAAVEGRSVESSNITLQSKAYVSRLPLRQLFSWNPLRLNCIHAKTYSHRILRGCIETSSVSFSRILLVSLPALG